MNLDLKRYVLATTMFCAALSGRAEVKLPALLGDNAVLQRNQSVVLWGEATPNKKVKVTTSWNDESYTTTSSKSGEFELEVATGDAGVGYSITFDDGDETTISNIMLGEVWLCSGQSNMALAMCGNPTQPIEGAEDAILKAKESTPIHFFKVPRTALATAQNSCKGEWDINSRKAILGRSATAFFFASYLNECLEVPVGIIDATWGGSKIESWMSRKALLNVKDYDFSAQDKGEVLPAPNRQPLYCYNGILSPLKNYRFKGMLWYQGESNKSNYGEYPQLFNSFITDLRENLFSCGEFPLYYVQIAPLGYANGESGYDNILMRESMGKIEEISPRAIMVPITDLGEEMCIHPRAKKEVGKRLAMVALGDSYGYDEIDFRAPKFDSVVKLKANNRRPTALSVKFKYAPRAVSFGKNRLSLFEVAGEDKVFYPATVLLDKNSKDYLVVYSDEVENPVAVRYAFSNFVVGNLYNSFGVALSSFRSDNWKVSEEQ